MMELAIRRLEGTPAPNEHDLALSARNGRGIEAELSKPKNSYAASTSKFVKVVFLEGFGISRDLG